MLNLSIDPPQPHDAALAAFPRLSSDPTHFASEMKQLGGAPSSHTLAWWFDALGRLQRWPAGSQEFFAAAAHALLDPGGLDAGLVLLRDGNQWQVAAMDQSKQQPSSGLRRSLLDRVVELRQTLFHDARAITDQDGVSCDGFVVAAPVLDAAGEVVAVVYGTRFDHQHNSRRGIRPLEAQFAQAVADAVSAALARLQRELEVVRLRSRLELAFSPAVARELEQNLDLLEGTQREVTVLFCDLRGYTAISERLTPRQSYALLGDVMDRFTQDIMDTGGVVLDYFGDGLAAFWNAPLPQAEHAQRACRAALAMCDSLPEISADWHMVTDCPLRIGIGIHTGTALVGNAGSQARIKYGPRGSAVNLASRVQSATRQFGVPILLTGATAQQLAGKLPTRSLSRFKLEGFADPVELHQLLSGEPEPQMTLQCEMLART